MEMGRGRIMAPVLLGARLPLLRVSREQAGASGASLSFM